MIAYIDIQHICQSNFPFTLPTMHLPLFKQVSHIYDGPYHIQTDNEAQVFVEIGQILDYMEKNINCV